MATRADRDELVRLFHAIEVHYWDEAVPASGSCGIAIAERDGRVLGLVQVQYSLDPLGMSTHIERL